jgi:hypothetical protein
MNNEKIDKVLGYTLYGVLWTLIVAGVPFVMYFT